MASRIHPLAWKKSHIAFMPALARPDLDQKAARYWPDRWALAIGLPLFIEIRRLEDERDLSEFTLCWDYVPLPDCRCYEACFKAIWGYYHECVCGLEDCPCRCHVGQLWLAAA